VKHNVEAKYLLRPHNKRQINQGKTYTFTCVKGDNRNEDPTEEGNLYISMLKFDESRLLWR
jgi:hypothetical protein